MLDITIKTIPHAEQRYPTVGDYQEQNGHIEFRISALSDWRREACVAIHEFAEKMWAQHHGVTDAQIDAFDMAYEAERQEGDDSEPGDDPQCPVYVGHQIATRIEHLLATALGIDWFAYEDEINAL